MAPKKGGAEPKAEPKAKAEAQTKAPGSPSGKKAQAEGSGAPQQESLKAARERLAARRAKIGLRTQPLTALRLALAWTGSFLVRTAKRILSSWVTWLVLVPSAGAWVAAKRSLAPQLFLPPVCGERDGGLLWQVELAVTEVAWWVILGILSSVGFGTGLHSGLMFLFPHVMQVVGAAEGCHTSAGLVAWYHHPCKLDCSTTYGPKDGSTVTMVRLWLLVTVQCMLWGVGTAMGELPPYLVSRAARLGGGKDSEYEAEIEEAKSSSDVFSRMKLWTIDFTQRHGFMGVLVLASWPNAAFDMCGMCCGYVLMPFWTFFLATCLGKGIIKVNLQAFFFIMLFGSAAFQVMLTGLGTVDTTAAGVLGRNFELRALAEKGRAKLVRQFELQSRFVPDKLFEGRGSHIDLSEMADAFHKHDDSAGVAQRVLNEWDKDKDGLISKMELHSAASRTDGKISLSSLDPGTGASLFKTLWELFIVGLVLFFLASVIDQLARTKQQELDDEELKRLAESRRKKD